MRLRRSYSTPSDTWPATSRRVTLKPSRSTPAASTAIASIVRSLPCGLADQEGDQHARAHRGARQQEGDRDAAPVWAQEAEQSPEGPHEPPYFTL
jgi:hypothetical protein